MTSTRSGLLDTDIRPALRSRLLTAHRGRPAPVVIEELGLCRGLVRIDLAVVDRHLHGYEIKSDRDTLRRLGPQMDLYTRVLDTCTLVVGARHVEDAVAALPPWWGVLCVDAGRRGPRFRTVRRASRNPARDARALVELLWLDEAMALLDERQAARGVRGKPRRMVWDRVCDHFALEEIAEVVRSRVRARATPEAARRPS